MRNRTFILAASFALGLTGSAFAQTPAGGGNTEGNMNNPGSVKSNSEKGMERSTGSATMAPGSTGTGSTMAPGSTTGTGTMAPMETAPAGSTAPAR